MPASLAWIVNIDPTIIIFWEVKTLGTYLLLFRPLKLCVSVLVVSPSSIERPLLVALRALQLVLQDVLGREEDNVGEVLHLGGRERD